MNFHSKRLMSRVLWGILTMGMILSLALGQGSLLIAHAQEKGPLAPIDESTRPNPSQEWNQPGPGQASANGPQFDPGGTSNISAASTSGPDDFGYTWDDSIPVSWINTAGGFSTGLTGNGQNNATAQISLPFAFKYYENSYTSLYISAAGYLSFTNNGNWPDQGSIPSASVPNNVIAPYWTRTYIGGGSWVHYAFGGDTPNRYFVVEWHNLTGGAPGDTRGQDDTYQFETILYENGNVVFQYGTNSYTGTNYCGSSGIEDSSGQYGLSYFVPCSWAPTNKAVIFYRPADSARLVVSPANQGQFTKAGAPATFQVIIRNTGSLGADTYRLTPSSAWSGSLFAANGTTPLSDTDFDGAIDTGPVPQGGTVTITVKIQTPLGAVLGDANTAILTVRSKLDSGVSKTASLKSAVPAPFVQGFEEETYAVSLDLIQPNHQQVVDVPGTCGCGENDVAVAKLPGQTYVYVWSHAQWVAPVPHSYIEYAILDDTGSPIVPVTRLTENDDVTTETYDLQPAVAVTPDGNIGILWDRQVNNANGSQVNFNEYLAILDPEGTVVMNPTNISQNLSWSTEGGLDWPMYQQNQVSATADNHFLLAWQENYMDNSDLVSQIDYSIWDSGGQSDWEINPFITTGLTLFESANAAGGNGTILTWLYNSDLYYAVINSNGDIIQDETNLTNDGEARRSSDAVLLSNGTTAIAWTNNDDTFPGKNQLAFAILDENYDLSSGPTDLYNPAAIQGNDLLSITSDGEAHAIITWTAPWFASRTELYYALVDSSGSVLTQPMPFRSANNWEHSLNISAIGNGIAPYDITTPPTVTSIIRADPNPTSAASVSFTVTFSEPVTGVDASDFHLTTSALAGASINGVSGSGATYRVTVRSGIGIGTLRLDLIDDDSIVDASNNPLGGTGEGNGTFTNGQIYSITRIQLYLPLIMKP